MSLRVVGTCVVAAGLLTGCGMFDGTPAKPTDRAINHVEDPNNLNPNPPNGGVAALFRDEDAAKPQGTNQAGTTGAAPQRPAGVTVNSYLWRATLDTVAFMPIASADPFGGVVITDWYSPTATPNERFKLNIFLLGRELRAEGVHAAVFHQTREPGKQWVDAVIDPQTTRDFENAILARARELQLGSQSK